MARQHTFNHRRCTACGELSITTAKRFIGGWFFFQCPNCRRQLRVDPQHGQRWILLSAFALIGAAAIAGIAVTDHTLALVGVGALACAVLYVWEFLLTRRAPLFVVTAAEAREYRQLWLLATLATICATMALAYLATQI